MWSRVWQDSRQTHRSIHFPAPRVAQGQEGDVALFTNGTSVSGPELASLETQTNRRRQVGRNLSTTLRTAFLNCRLGGKGGGGGGLWLSFLSRRALFGCCLYCLEGHRVVVFVVWRGNVWLLSLLFGGTLFCGLCRLEGHFVVVFVVWRDIVWLSLSFGGALFGCCLCCLEGH